MEQNGSLRDRQRVLNVLTQAWRRLAEHVNLDEMAGLSPFHFHRVFERVTGETFRGRVRSIAHALQDIVLPFP